MKKSQEEYFFEKIVFFYSHSSFIARYETAVAAYYDLMDQFWETKSKYLWRKISERECLQGLNIQQGKNK